MCTIKLSPILDGKTYPEAGSILYDKLSPAMKTDTNIILDMQGVDLLPSMFLNVSLGRIITEFGRSNIKKISFTNISRSQAQRIKDYILKFSPDREDI